MNELSDIFSKTALSTGQKVWIQRIKIPGIRKPAWTVVVTGQTLLERPLVIDCHNRAEADAKLATILKADVLEQDGGAKC